MLRPFRYSRPAQNDLRILESTSALGLLKCGFREHHGRFDAKDGPSHGICAQVTSFALRQISLMGMVAFGVRLTHGPFVSPCRDFSLKLAFFSLCFLGRSRGQRSVYLDLVRDLRVVLRSREELGLFPG
jgi:hypothetical protein